MIGQHNLLTAEILFDGLVHLELLDIGELFLESSKRNIILAPLTTTGCFDGQGTTLSIKFEDPAETEEYNKGCRDDCNWLLSAVDLLSDNISGRLFLKLADEAPEEMPWEEPDSMTLFVKVYGTTKAINLTREE